MKVSKMKKKRFKKVLMLTAIVGMLASAGGASASMRGSSGAFTFEPVKGKWLDVLYKGKRIARYMCGHDTSDAAKTFETYKPFLHVYDPASGRRLTNGPDGENPYLKDEIRYPHHRGIFIGWNRLTFEGKRYDLWHMPQAHQVHQEFEAFKTTADSASFTSVVHWNDDTDEKGEPILVEHRTMRITAPPHGPIQSAEGIAVVDFETELKAVCGQVFLNGDPEHAGVQYRAHNDVEAGPAESKAKYLFHADGIDPRRDKDLPWVAMKYELDGTPYVVQHMNHPRNPKETVYSAYRDYGRFGAFFTETLDQGETLTLRYRIWIDRGDMPDRRDLASRHSVFVEAPNVEISKR